MTGGITAPLEVRDLSRRLPDRTVLVVYAVVEDRLVTWLVRRSGLELSPLQPDWSKVDDQARLLTRSPSKAKLLASLHADLVTPWKQRLRAGDRIFFVPTRTLYGIPFAALIDPETGRYLVQDHAVAVVPSASELLASLERDRLLSSQPIARVLLAGDPTWPRTLYPSFPTLVGRQEISLLGRVYQGIATQVLTQRQATPGRVLAALREADIVHMSAHSIADPKDPNRSRFLLSSQGDDPGELSVHDLHELRLPRTRLVVLASCGSHAGPVSESEGSLSLARSFLAAGVPSVVGSLWRVDDAKHHPPLCPFPPGNPKWRRSARRLAHRPARGDRRASGSKRLDLGELPGLRWS